MADIDPNTQQEMERDQIEENQEADVQAARVQKDLMDALKDLSEVSIKPLPPRDIEIGGPGWGDLNQGPEIDFENGKRPLPIDFENGKGPLPIDLTDRPERVTFDRQRLDEIEMDGQYQGGTPIVGNEQATFEIEALRDEVVQNGQELANGAPPVGLPVLDKGDMQQAMEAAREAIGELRDYAPTSVGAGGELTAATAQNVEHAAEAYKDAQDPGVDR